jgi:lipid-A-disaccharide synthase
MTPGGRRLRVGMVAGEASGDQLGAGLVRALRRRHPDAVFEGVGGPRMEACGFTSLWPIDPLAVMGLFEVVRHLPGLLELRRALRRHFTAVRPDVFIGIDAPDFNLPLERNLRRRGVKTAHFVSPSVWAWRRSRVRGIARSVDLMLTLFPFESDFYAGHDVPVRCVGHPLADVFPEHPDREAARGRLGLSGRNGFVALLPGSRAAEVRSLAGPFIETAAWCLRRRPGLRFLVPLANRACAELFEAALARHGAGLPLVKLDGRSREAMEAADVVLTASGTATLEAMLMKRPMVVAYRLSAPTYHLARMMVKTPHFSLPNLLAGRALVPEFLQAEVTAARLGAALLYWLDHPAAARELCAEFSRIHADLRRNADRTAAEAVLELVGQ